MKRLVASVGAVVIVAACGTPASGWRAHVWSEPPEDAQAEPVAVPFERGQHGTQLVLALLELAKRRDATLSRLEVQIGTCARAIGPGGPRSTPPSTAAREADLIVAEVKESAFRCRRKSEQIIVHAGSGFGDTQVITTPECGHAPVEHIVLRYRYELDHGFVPPDFSEIERWMGVQLAFDPPRCGLPARTEVRAHFHHKDRVEPPTPGSGHGTGSAPARSARLATLKRSAADAARAANEGNPIAAREAARRALQILSALEPGELDERMAHWIAAARYHSLEQEVAAFLADEPASIDQRWGDSVGSAIDRITHSYEAIGDVVRAPQAAQWLRLGAARVASLHERVADLLEASGQDTAAEAARHRAERLREVASAASRP